MKAAPLFTLLCGILCATSSQAVCLAHPTDEVTVAASALFSSKDRAHQELGLARLRDAAANGNSTARICLAWLHLNKLIPDSNNEDVLALLQDLGARHATTAHILRGAAYAEGSTSTTPDLNSAKEQFIEAKRRLDAGMRELQQRPPPQTAEDMAKAMALQSDYTLLFGFSKKYGVQLNSP